jgi:hypothetical protein
MFFRPPITCRVCGTEFAPRRFDAVFCSETCRRRFRGGGNPAYFARLTPAEKRRHRRIQRAHDERIAAGRRVSAAIRAQRAASREQRYLEQAKRQDEDGADS